MNLLFRLAAIVIGALFASRIAIGQVSNLRSRVWPLDLDLNRHMTNSRYLALCDLGRVDLILRTGAWRNLWKGRIGVVLGGCSMRFRRSLHPFERFTLSTNILGWDERWIYVRQIFTGRDGVACIAMMRAGFTRRGRLVSPHEVTGQDEKPPPGWVQRWNDLESEYVAEAASSGVGMPASP